MCVCVLAQFRLCLFLYIVFIVDDIVSLLFFSIFCYVNRMFVCILWLTKYLCFPAATSNAHHSHSHPFYDVLFLYLSRSSWYVYFYMYKFFFWWRKTIRQWNKKKNLPHNNSQTDAISSNKITGCLRLMSLKQRALKLKRVCVRAFFTNIFLD